MKLPVMPPLKPMLAKAQPQIPDQPEGDPAWLYEPKWDGFRCLVFRDGDDVVLGSRNLKPLDRYFPEVLDAVRAEAASNPLVKSVRAGERGEGGDGASILTL